MKASGSLVVRNIGRLLPMTGTGPFSVVRAAVLVRDGTVEYASEEAGLDPSAAAGVPVLDADGGLVSPGLIDCHTHLVFAGSRSDEFVDRCRGVPYEAIAARGGGIARTVEAVRAASREDLVREALPRVWRALAMGVTTIEAKSGYGLDLPNELKLLRAVRDLDAATPADLVATFLGAHALPRGVADREAHVAAIAEEWIPAVAEAGLARFCDCFCEGVAFTPAECERVLRAGIAAGLAPKAHAEQLTRSGGAALAARVGAVSADHLDCATPEDLDALARAGVVAVLLPGCGVSLGRPRFPDARPFVAAGVKVAVSTDFNPGSCVTQDLPLVATIAMAFCGLPLEATWAAVTANAADALAIGDRVGRLAPGFEGDLVVFRGDDAAGPFCEWGGAPRVRTVVKKGRVVAGEA